jgi:phage terminase large subunit
MLGQLKLLHTYHPFPRQNEFHASPAKFRLFGGAAGPGKTAALVWEAVMQNFEVAGSTCLLLRRTLRQLEDSLEHEFNKSVPWREVGARFSEHLVTWPNGSKLRFGYCEGEKDVYQYQGGEYLFIGFDELTHFTLKQWQFLTSRNRHPGRFASMAGATNPGNVGHEWVNALWGCDGKGKHPAPGMDEPEKYEPRDYDFIRARIADNPIYANDATYLHTLDGLGKDLRKAMLEGLWDVFAGQYFDIFNVPPHHHVGKRRGSEIVSGEKVYSIEPWWPKWISFDWGFNHDFAAHWHTTAPDGVHITYREWVDHGITPRMLGEGLVERTVDREGRREKIQQFFLDPYCYADRTGESTIAELIRDVACRGDRLPMPAEASDDRVGGWQLLYQLLEADQWLIAENCEKLIARLPILIRDDKKPEDVKKVDGDDAPDSARYGLYSRLGAAKIPVEIRAKEAVKHLNDPTERAVMLEKFMEKEKRLALPTPLIGRHGSGRRWRPGQNR